MEIYPKTIHAGTPITVLLTESEATSATAHVSRKNSHVSDSFEVPVSKVGHKATLEFTVGLPGQYQLSVGALTIPIHVKGREELSFGLEMVLFTTTLVIALGGIWLWLKAYRQRHGAQFS